MFYKYLKAISDTGTFFNKNTGGNSDTAKLFNF